MVHGFLWFIAFVATFASFAMGYYRFQSSRFSLPYLISPMNDFSSLLCSLSLVESSSLLFSRLYAATSEDQSTESIILKQIDTWACVKSCGACCKLGPLSSRPDLKDYLTNEEFATYTSMVGDDDWCKNYDKTNRMCTIYETRPIFCRVEPKNFEKMFDVKREEFAVS